MQVALVLIQVAVFEPPFAQGNLKTHPGCTSSVRRRNRPVLSDGSGLTASRFPSQEKTAAGRAPLHLPANDLASTTSRLDEHVAAFVPVNEIGTTRYLSDRSMTALPWPGDLSVVLLAALFRTQGLAGA